MTETDFDKIDFGEEAESIPSLMSLADVPPIIRQIEVRYGSYVVRFVVSEDVIQGLGLDKAVACLTDELQRKMRHAMETEVMRCLTEQVPDLISPFTVRVTR